MRQLTDVSRRRAVLLAAASLPLVLSFVLVAPASRAATQEDFGQLSVTREHVKWPPPVSVVRDLQSPDAGVRFRALILAGVPEKLARIPVSTNATAWGASGAGTVKPEQIELRFAALGGDDAQQAILTAQVARTYAFAAVAVQKASGWERIAVFDCWCKYDARSVVDTFVSLSAAPDAVRGDETGRYELVLRASGGGTGLYRQNEARFRFYNGEMKAVMVFVSRVQSVGQGRPAPWYLEIERRWFYPALPVRLADGRSESVAVLVESRGETAMPPAVFFVIPQLQDRYLKGVSCRTFRWDQGRFRYEPVSVPNACSGTSGP